MVDPAYQPFLRKANGGSCDLTVRVLVEAGSLPDRRGLSRMFAGPSWSMCADGEDRLILLDPPGVSRHPLWAARLDRDFVRVHVFCGERLKRRSGAATVLENPLKYPLDQILLMYALSRRRGAILHAAGVGIRGRAFLFAGPSGAGT